MGSLLPLVAQSFPSAPGALPLLGTGASFGMSRRLRRRIGVNKLVV